MAVFTFDNMGSNGGSASNNWNYSDKEKPDFALQIDGTVVELKQVQETQFQTNAPLFWKNENGRAKKVTEDTGSPCLNFCVVIDTQQFGEKEWIFNPKTKKDPKTNPDGLSRASMAIQKALMDRNMDPKNLDQLGGMDISVSTKEAPDGFSYGPTSPRPFSVRINGKGSKEFRGCFPFKKGYDQAGAQPSNAQLQRAMEGASNAMNEAGMRQQCQLSSEPSYFQAQPNPYADQDIPF